MAGQRHCGADAIVGEALNLIPQFDSSIMVDSFVLISRLWN